MPTCPPPRRFAAPAILVGVLGAVLGLGGAWPSRSTAAGRPVAVYPIAGSRVASPRTQIAFRGVPAGQIGRVVVTGSRSGRHAGVISADSDGEGGSFIPKKPFRPGEKVTVSTHLHIVHEYRGTFRFWVARPAGRIPNRPFAPAPRLRGDVYHFHSRPDIHPVGIHVNRFPSGTAHGYIFLATEFGPLLRGPMVLDSNGGLVWTKNLPGYQMATVVRVQTLYGTPVLTWWQGNFGAGFGSGEDVINDDHYRVTHVIKCANGLHADLHAFVITPQNTALVVCEFEVHWNTSSVGGARSRPTFDGVVQEIDIPTGNVVFQWDTLDHVPVKYTYNHVPKVKGHPFDYFHLNSVDQDGDGNIVISGRSVSAVYKVRRSDGRIMWTLGGKHSSFKAGPGATAAFQHDAMARAHNVVSMMDNGAGLYNAHRQSRALWVQLKFSNHTYRRIRELDHSPPLLAHYEGDVEQLYNGDTFVGWGQQPYFSEYDRGGRVNFDARFNDRNASYTAYRFHWNGYPKTQPAVAAANRGRKTSLWASWNGSTKLARWRVLAGSSSNRLRPVLTTRKLRFETPITISRTSYVAVQALDSNGHRLSTSKTIRT
jgi:hypothetical protein